MSLRLVATAALVSFGLMTSTAGAAPEVDPLTNKQYAFTIFSTECYGEGCRVLLRIYDGDRRVFLGRLAANEEDDWYFSRTYDWTCRYTGRLRWTVTVAGYAAEREDGSGTVDTSGNGIAKGTLTVPRCSQSKPRRVRRGYVAASAAAEYEDEFVSRSVCSPLTRVVNGKASSWRCYVVHNNTYRECGTTLRMRYTQRLKFGKREYKEHVKRLSTRCRSY